MDENKKNEELIKFKKQWFNEDNQPVAGIELTLPPDIGSMLDSKSVDDESGKVIMNKFNLYASIRVLFYFENRRWIIKSLLKKIELNRSIFNICKF